MSKPLVNIKSIFSGDIISVKAIFFLFWSRKKIFVISMIIFGLLGYIVAKTTPQEYVSRCVLLSEQGGSGTNNSSLQNLASLLGGGASGGANDPGGSDLYPLILSNRPFLIELAKLPVYLKDKKTTTTLREYFRKDPKTDALTSFKKLITDLPQTIKGWFSSSKPPINTATGEVAKITTSNDSGRLNLGIVDSVKSQTSFTDTVSVTKLEGEDAKIAGILAERITFNQTGKLITLSLKMPEADICAVANKMILDQLIKYVVRYKTAKQLETVDFLEARSGEAYVKYKSSQQRLAGFKDNNYGVIFQSIQATEQQLQNEFTLAFGVYNGLVSQLEQARIQLKKDTPLFTVLEPIYVPSAPADIDKVKIISTYLTTGFLIGFMIVLLELGRLYYIQNKSSGQIISG